jgi:hypothetical protein
MDRAYIDQRQVIERYLRGTLAPDELSAFEIYMLDHPETVDDVEYARGLQEAMIAGQSAWLPSGGVRSGRTGFWLGPRYAAAATVLLAVTGISALYQYQRNAALTAEIAQLGAPAVVANDVWLESMRGAQSVVIEKPPEQSLLLRIVVDPRTQGPYDVRIGGVDNAFRWSRSNVSADAENSVRVVARDLAFGRYQLTLTSQNPTRIATEYTFELVAPE